MADPTPNVQKKLETQRNIWFASVRPNGRPHLAPVWFVWHAGKLYVCTAPSSVKARNISQNSQVVLALEDGSNPVICEGRATPMFLPWPAEIVAAFQQKYEWDISSENQYTQLVEVTPVKWLSW